MARKVFISFLGTGNYVESKYQFPDNTISEPVRFIQEAIIKHTCKKWTENDKILIFCTEESYKKNWLDNGHINPTKPNPNLEEIEKIGLETRLKATPYWNLVERHQIKEGFDEKEVWDIFDAVYEQINDNDEVYFDVTHAFRSIPMFSTILFNYASFMKNIEVKNIQYGAFEKLGPSYKVKAEIPIEKRIAPTLNLTNLIRLQEYTDVASSFTSFGRVKKLSDALKTESTESNAVIKEIYTALENFDNALVTNRLSEIKEGKYMLVIKNSIKPLNKQKIPTPIKLIISRIYKELEDFGFTSANSSQNIEAAINWLKHYKMLAQAYTTGQEYIISLVADMFKNENPYTIPNVEEFDKKKRKNLEKENAKKFRMYMSSICSISDKDIANEDFRHALLEHKELTRKLLSNSTINNLRKYFAELGENRNAINHGKGNVTYEELENEFDELFHNCLSIIKTQN